VGVRPAEALLASSLVQEEELDELIEEICGLGKKKGIGRVGEEDMGRLGTGVKSVDDALDGGLVGGRVVGIWGESGGAGMEVSIKARWESAWLMNVGLSSITRRFVAEVPGFDGCGCGHDGEFRCLEAIQPYLV
jgi:hypothetical protein